MSAKYIRLGEFDYQEFGIKECWGLVNAANMLASFIMEVGGLFESEKVEQVYSKLYDNSVSYIIKSLRSEKVRYGHDFFEGEGEYLEPGDIVHDRAWFYKDELLAYMETCNDLKLDVELLKKYLTREETPKIQVSYKIISEPEAKKEVTSAPKELSPVVVEAVQNQKTAEENSSEKMSLMWKYAFDIAAFCKVNADDDHIPIFEDVVHHLELKYGKDHVPDSWIKEILEYAPVSMAKKDGRPRKILPDAIKAGFCMREWYDDDNKITELQFKDKFKKYLPKVSANVRAKAWDCLDKIKKEGTQGADK